MLRVSDRAPFELIDTDQAFFADHPTRRTRIRDAIGDEQAAAFQSLGDHDAKRRRIVIWKLPPSMRQHGTPELLKIPFLAFGDETIENEDSILMPLIHQLMADAAKHYGIEAPQPMRVVQRPRLVK